MDAHDGDLLQVGGTTYLYGTAYGCGFTLGQPSPYCGVRIYSSVDLASWKVAGAVGGYAFDHLRTAWQSACAPTDGVYGCFRPHVIRRPSDGRYVMWVNIHGDKGYSTLVASSPAGPFVDTGIVPNLAVKPEAGGLRYGDMDLEVAPDGRLYIAYTVINKYTNAHAIIIERLDPSGITGSGWAVGVDTDPTAAAEGRVTLSESPALFHSASNDQWYLAFSDAAPYRPTRTGIVEGVKGANPLGAWDPSTSRILAPTGCDGQVSGIWPIVGPSGVRTYVFGSDQWIAGLGNQVDAVNYMTPLTFTAADGTQVDPVECLTSWHLS